MKRSSLLVMLAMVLLLALAPAASAHETGGAAQVERGFTLLELDPATAKALTDAGVRVSAVPPAGAGGSAARPAFVFPVVGGALSTDPLGGRIRHSGGLEFSAGKKSLTVKNFVINLRQGVLTARVVDGPRVPLLTLEGGKANVRGPIVTLAGVEASLTPEAATALNDTLGTDAFAGGLLVGKASSIVLLAR